MFKQSIKKFIAFKLRYFKGIDELFNLFSKLDIFWLLSIFSIPFEKKVDIIKGTINLFNMTVANNIKIEVETKFKY